MLQQLARDLFGAPNVQVNAPDWLRGGVEVFGTVLAKSRLFTIALAIACLVAIWFFLNHLAQGRRMRAVMQNRPLAACAGIPTDQVDRLTFFIGSGLAGVAGVALTLFGSIGPTLGTNYIIDAFLVVVVGGLGQLRGAVIAALASGPDGLVLRVLDVGQRREGDGVRRRRGVPAVPSARHRRTPNARLDMKAKSLRGHTLFVLVGLLLVFGAPSMLSDFRLSLLAKYLCFAILAIGVDLSWGYGGMLVLGQGVFFGLGGYCMGMYLKLKAAGPGPVARLHDVERRRQAAAAVETISICVVRAADGGAVAHVRGWILGTFIFRQPGTRRVLRDLDAGARRRVRDVARRSAGAHRWHQRSHQHSRVARPQPARQRRPAHVLYFIVVGVLGVVFIIARHLVNSRYGRLLVAVRDGEDRVRFLGYDPAKVKTSAFAISAGMAGLAGALFVPVVGIISPALLGVVPSIEMVIWVAVGGRATIYGAVLGAVVVNWAKTNLSERYPSGWLYFQGALFVIVMMFAPRGIAGLRSTLGGTVAHLRARFDWRDHAPSTPPATTEVIDRAEIVA